MNWYRGGFLLAVVSGVALMVGIVAFPAPAQADETTAFTARFTADIDGDIVVIGNSLLAHQDGKTIVIDADTDPTTSQSSMARLPLPYRAKVVWAGLYWTGSEPTEILLQVPGSDAYQTVTAMEPPTDSNNPTDTNPNNPTDANNPQRFADVTSLIAQAGVGEYWGANLAASGENLVGWALTVVYTAPGLPLRHLSVVDGWESVTSEHPVRLTVPDLATPPIGAVTATLHMLAYPGLQDNDGGNSASINGTKLSTSLSPEEDFFNNTIDLYGVSPDRLPLESTAVNIKNVVGQLANDTTSATIELTSTGRNYHPAMLGLAIDLHAPDFAASTTTAVVNGGSPAQPGDVIEYTVTFINSGTDSSTDTVSVSPLPTGSQYVPGSLKLLTSLNGPMVLTDQAGDDVGEFTGDAVKVRLGAGADPTNGGTIAIGVSAGYSFQVRLNDQAGGTVTNTSHLNFIAATTQIAVSIDNAPVVTPVENPAAELTGDPSRTGDPSLSSVPSTNPVGQTPSSPLTSQSPDDTAPEPVQQPRAKLTPPSPDNTTANPLDAPLPHSTPQASETTSSTSVQADPPSPTPKPEPTAEPEATPEPEPTADPEPTAKPEPDPEPEPTPETTPQPAPLPEPDPEPYDLQLFMVSDPNTSQAADGLPLFHAGALVSYTLAVWNPGPGVSPAAMVTDLLPIGLSFDQASSPDCAVSSSGDPTAGIAEVVTCQIDPLQPDQTHSVRLVASTSPTDLRQPCAQPDNCGANSWIPRLITNTAAVTTNSDDANPSNDMASTSAHLTGVANLTTKLVPATQMITAGSKLVYGLVLTNDGPSIASAPALTVNFAPGFTIETWQLPGTECHQDPIGQSLVCTVPPGIYGPAIQPGQRLVGTVTVKTSTALEEGTYPATAQATCNTSCSNNNTSTVDVTVHPAPPTPVDIPIPADIPTQVSSDPAKPIPTPATPSAPAKPTQPPTSPSDPATPVQHPADPPTPAPRPQPAQLATPIQPSPSTTTASPLQPLTDPPSQPTQSPTDTAPQTSPSDNATPPKTTEPTPPPTEPSPAIETTNTHPAKDQPPAIPQPSTPTSDTAVPSTTPDPIRTAPTNATAPTVVSAFAQPVAQPVSPLDPPNCLPPTDQLVPTDEPAALDPQPVCPLGTIRASQSVPSQVAAITSELPASSLTKAATHPLPSAHAASQAHAPPQIRGP